MLLLDATRYLVTSTEKVAGLEAEAHPGLAICDINEEISTLQLIGEEHVSLEQLIDWLIIRWRIYARTAGLKNA